MDKKEFIKIVAAIKTAYPSSNVLSDEAAIDLWFTLLSEHPYTVVQAATLEHISTGKFPPSIADIREKCTGYMQIPVGDWSEAWETVLKAIRKYGYMQEVEALESMDELTRTCLKRLGYQNICMSENITADRANYREIYEAESKRRKENAKIPKQLQTQKQQMIEQIIDSTVQKIEKKEEPQGEHKTADMDQVSILLNGLKEEMKW